MLSHWISLSVHGSYLNHMFLIILAIVVAQSPWKTVVHVPRGQCSVDLRQGASILQLERTSVGLLDNTISENRTSMILYLEWLVRGAWHWETLVHKVPHTVCVASQSRAGVFFVRPLAEPFCSHHCNFSSISDLCAWLLVITVFDSCMREIIWRFYVWILSVNIQFHACCMCQNFILFSWLIFHWVCVCVYVFVCINIYHAV